MSPKYPQVQKYVTNKCSFVFDSVPNENKTQGMCNKILYVVAFELKYCHD